MARSKLAWLFLTTALVAAPVGAQTIADALALAERAAQEAERSAAAAADAARQARAAVDALKTLQGQTPAMGTAPAPAAEPPPESGSNTDPGSTSLTSNNRPADENLSVYAAIEAPLFGAALSRTVANGSNDGFLKSAYSPDFQFTVSEKEKIASISMSFDISATHPGSHLSTEQLTLTGSGKLNDDERTFTDLKGFTNGTEVSLTYTNYSTKVQWGQQSAQIDRIGVDIARQNCLTAKKAARAGQRIATQDAFDANAEKKAIEADTTGVCNPYNPANTGVSMFMETYNPGGLQKLLDDMLPDDVNFWGVKAAGNQATYKYLDRATFTELKDDRFGFSASVFAGRLFDKGTNSGTLSLTYKKDFEAADPVTLCQPVANTTFAQCYTSPDGKPTRKDQTILALEGRHAFPLNADGKLAMAMAAEVSADLNSDAYSLVVPVYFASGDGGKLRGGIRGVYLNQKDEKNGGRDDEFSVGVFVGAPFSVFPY